MLTLVYIVLRQLAHLTVHHACIVPKERFLARRQLQEWTHSQVSNVPWRCLMFFVGMKFSQQGKWVSLVTNHVSEFSNLFSSPYLHLIPSFSTWGALAPSAECTSPQETCQGPPPGSSPLVLKHHWNYKKGEKTRGVNSQGTAQCRRLEPMLIIYILN